MAEILQNPLEKNDKEENRRIDLEVLKLPRKRERQLGGKNNHRKGKFPLAADSFRHFHNEGDEGPGSAITSQSKSKVTSGKLPNTVSSVFDVTAKSKTVY